MAQSDQVVQNATFPSVRADINDNLAALYSQSSGNTAPTVTVAFQPWVDTSSNPPVKKIRNGSNTAWLTEGVLDPAGFTPSGIPTGQIIHVALSSAPTGYLKANGAAVSRSTYATLFAAIGTTFGAGDGSTTFNVPDLRGEFVRGWDDSRGIDSARTFGSAQADEFETHFHFSVSSSTTSGSTPVPSATNAVASAGWTSIVNDSRYALTGVSDYGTVGRSSIEGGTETRPRNIALLACIKF
jgi:phage-related tail fiber protein